MKKIAAGLVLLALFTAYDLSAQNGLAHIIGAGVNKLRNRKVTILKMGYNLDSFTYRGRTSAIQRYTKDDLAASYSQGGNEYLVSMSLYKLQEQFDMYKRDVQANRELKVYQGCDGYFADIRRSGLAFDATNYQNEYTLYKYYSAQYQADQQRKSDSLQEERRRNDSVIQAHVAAVARERAIKKAYDDSVAAIERAKRDKEANVDMAKYRQELVKKYGAQNAARIMANKVWIGMTDEMCLASLTEPNNVAVNYTAAGKTEIWIYRGVAKGCIGADCPWLNLNITFKDHKATSIVEGQ